MRDRVVHHDEQQRECERGGGHHRALRSESSCKRLDEHDAQRRGKMMSAFDETRRATLQLERYVLRGSGH